MFHLYNFWAFVWLIKIDKFVYRCYVYSNRTLFVSEEEGQYEKKKSPSNVFIYII